MAAIISVSEDQVLVKIDGGLKYDIWRELRDARDTARSSNRQLCIDMQNCCDGDMAGIGSILLAQEELSSVRIKGCDALFVRAFRSFGICRNCAQETESPLGCMKQRAVAHS